MPQGPIKVSTPTKERVRYAAVLAGLSQSDLVERAVAEYVERHAGELFAGLEHAREALGRGLNASVSYALGVSEEDINRIAENRMVNSSRSRLAARPAQSRRVQSPR